uniref:Dynein assembly factor 4, axonemal n=1 Tax=Glossina brevipalpis TaxID=37001 RepID=A0A1A9W0S9_9MUSC
MNRLITKRPDVVLLPTYLKFNNPPIFFERHLAHEIDEVASYCRILKNEARIVLIKKHKGVWPEIFKKLSKEELFQKRLEISDLIVARNKERDDRILERYEQKRRAEVEREVQRETAMRERVKKFQEQACNDVMTIAPKETHIKPKMALTKLPLNTKSAPLPSQSQSQPELSLVNNRAVASTPTRALPALRNSGKINVSFTNFIYVTPKRESQEGKPRPFVVEDDLPKPEECADL